MSREGLELVGEGSWDVMFGEDSNETRCNETRRIAGYRRVRTYLCSVLQYVFLEKRDML